ncbi:MAG: DUF1801 domain-containing protein [Cyclobacteriaceae bacterium]|nr:MAG: DUF1801 domain-containing protein [Cyclobacteriaceae bacterium]
MKPSKKSVDEIIADLPKHEQVVVKRLRSLILECLPKATEKNSYGVPFYTRNRMICLIWPPSIYWGPKKSDYQEKGVTLGFCQGNLFANEDGALLAEGRKQVYCMYFHRVDEINEEQIRALLFEADLIDQQFRKPNRNRGRKSTPKTD